MNVDSAIAIAVAAVLAASSVGKLLRLGPFGLALTGTYGIPTGIARPLKVLVPVYEMAAAILLANVGTRALGLISSGVFFAVAFVIVAAAYVTGRTGDCGCFGELIQQPLGRGTSVRLSILLSLNGIALMLAVPSLDGRLLFPSAIEWVVAASGLVIAVTVFLAARRATHAMRDR
jgi:Ca2+/Na+ antiporter